MAQAPSTSRLRVVWALDAYMMRPRRKNGKTLAIQTRTPTISHKHHDIPKTLQTLWPQKQQRNKKQPRKKVTKQLHCCKYYQSSIVSTGIRIRLIAPDELIKPMCTCTDHRISGGAKRDSDSNGQRPGCYH
jgi:hypothetical protein